MTSWRTGPLSDSELVDGIRLLDLEATRAKLQNSTKHHDACQRMADALAALRDRPRALAEVNDHWTMRRDDEQ